MKKSWLVLSMLFVFFVTPITGQAASNPTVDYQSSLQKTGWQSWKSNGTTSGTTGQNKRLEAIKLKISNTTVSGKIEYKAYVQKQGWDKTYRANGTVAGTTGKNLRMEAIQIRLTGDLAKKYDLYYRVNIPQYGWLGWAKNGAQSGSSGLNFQIEAIQVKLVKKGSKAPGSTTNPFHNGTKKYVDAKGNGSIKGSSAKIFHLPGGQYYKQTTKPVKYFKTEAEAVKAGYRPAK